MADTVVDDIKVILSADDKAAKGPIDDLIARLENLDKAANGTGNASRDLFKKMASGAESSNKALSKAVAQADKHAHTLAKIKTEEARTAAYAAKADATRAKSLADTASKMGKYETARYKESSKAALDYAKADAEARRKSMVASAEAARKGAESRAKVRLTDAKAATEEARTEKAKADAVLARVRAEDALAKAANKRAAEESKLNAVAPQSPSVLDRIADAAERAGSALASKLSEGAKKAGLALAKLAVAPLTGPIKALTGTLSKFGAAASNLFRQIKRVVMYRAIRSAIRMVTDGFKEGIQNAYQWSKAMGGTFAASMDRLSTASLYLKNSLGALATPIINAVAPAIDWLIDKFVALLNVINQVIALLTGAKTWTKAVKYPKEYAEAANQAAGGAGKLAKAMVTILSIDELNPLNADNGGGGGGGGASGSALDYSEMFKEVETTSNALDKLFEPVTNAWQNKGQEVLDSLSNALSGVKQLAESVASSFFEVWENGTGQETIEHILGIFTGINNTVGNIARQLAIGWNTDNLGTQIIQNFWNILNNILGLWDRIANATAEWAKGLDFVPILTAFSNLSGAFERLSKVVTDSLGDAWENVILPVGKWLIESGLPAAIEAIAKAIDFVAMALETLIGILKEMKKFIDELAKMSLPDFLKGFFGGDLAVGGSPSELASSAAAATFGVKFKVTDIIDKIPGAKKIIEGLTGWLQKRKLGEKVTLPISGLTAGMTKRTLGEKTKAPISLAANMVKRTLGNKVVLPIPNLTGNITKRTVGGKILDPVTGMTASFNKSQNAMSEEQRRFYATARFNQSQNALGTPTINARANFTDYSSEFSKVKMALQITDAFKPNGQRISLIASGGAFYDGKWHDIAQYATGGVPSHGSLFMAGEAGAEIVGHVGGRTEVLNQSQIASTIAAATQMSNASQNNILMQLLNGVEQLVEGQGDVRAYIPAGEVVSGLQRNNRRDGRALVPMGV